MSKCLDEIMVDRCNKVYYVGRFMSFRELKNFFNEYCERPPSVYGALSIHDNIFGDFLDDRDSEWSVKMVRPEGDLAMKFDLVGDVKDIIGATISEVHEHEGHERGRIFLGLKDGRRVVLESNGHGESCISVATAESISYETLGEIGWITREEFEAKRDEIVETKAKEALEFKREQYEELKKLFGPGGDYEKADVLIDGDGNVVKSRDGKV